MSDSSDPFKQARAEAAEAKCNFQEETIAMLLRHKEVKAAARDWHMFSSDAPFRVPIPSEEGVRSIRQLPIETNPPEHGEYRELIEDFFTRPRQPEMQARIAAMIDELLRGAINQKSVECVHDFALPLQSRSLACLLKVPESEAEEWISWGVNALKDTELSSEKGANLERYIRRRLEQAKASPADDFFSVLVTAKFRGRKLTEEEMLGFSNLVFAGGRDTVIHMVSSVLAYFAGNPSAMEALRGNPRAIMTATEEFFRHVSPLTHIGRVCPHQTQLQTMEVAPDQRVSLCWASANRDETVFENAEDIRLDRKPNPHIAFGSDAHTCIGALHARALIRILIETLGELVSRITLLEEEKNMEEIAQFSRHVGYERLVLAFTPREES